MSITMIKNKKAESFVACGSFLAAVGLAFTALILSEHQEIDSSVLMMCAQFLLLTASIFGLDYKFSDLINRYEARKSE